MMHINKFISMKGLQNRKFLVIGKGPSFQNIGNYDCSEYVTISLNHVVRERKVFISHLIDFDVIGDCATAIYENSSYLLMPYYPHFNHCATDKSVRHLIKTNNILKLLDEEGRLIWYNLGTTRRCKLGYRRRKLGYPVVPGGYFSGEVVTGVLAAAGVKYIRTIGIDGGAQYGSDFSDLNQNTLLANGRESFDIQFGNIKDYIMKYNLDYASLDEKYPIKVYVATTEAQMLATKVLEYSIRKHTSYPVEVVAMHKCGIDYSEPVKLENRQKTPFSFQRFLIPKLSNYQGKAIYLDSDMQVFDDINKLWSLPMGSRDLITAKSAKGEGRRLHFSVMLLDCNKLDWDIHEIIKQLDAGQLTYTQLMHEMKLAKDIAADISEHWNSLERYVPGKTCLLHYTDMDTQPWINTKNPFESVWMKDLIEAVDSHIIEFEYVVDHVEKGWVRPGLLFQLEHKILSSKNLPKHILTQDRAFRPPYEQLVCAKGLVADNAVDKMKVKVYKMLRSITRRF